MTNRSKFKGWPKLLKTFRETNKLTQKELADILQISLRTVENWESAVCMPPPYLKMALTFIESSKDNG